MRYQLRYVRLPHVPVGLRGPATVSELAGALQTGRTSVSFAVVPPAPSLTATRPLDGPGSSPPQENCRLTQTVTACPRPRPVSAGAREKVQASNESGTGIALSS